MNAYPKRLLARVTAPASEPATLAEAKLYLRVDATADDTLITELITLARIQAEEYLRRSLITQSWKLAYDDGIPAEVFLPRGPVTGITSVTAYDRTGAATVISSGTYTLNAAQDTLVLDAAVISFRVEIIYGTGYGAAAAVPAPIKYGMLAHVAAMYDRRGDAEMPMPAQTLALYAPFREVRV